MVVEIKKPSFIKNMILTGQLTRLVVYLATAVPAIILILLAILVHIGVLSSLKIGPIHIGTSVDFLAFAFFLSCGTFGVYEHARFRRVRRIDERFPDFVRDLAESRRAGMTFTKAITYSSQGNYGMLTPEIKKIAQQISWGSSAEDALTAFSSRVNTKLIRRTISLIIEASKSGGNVADVLDAASKDAREIRLLERERRATMISYVAVIYVSMLVFLLIIAVLCVTFIPAMTTEGASGLAATKGAFSTIKKDDIVPVFFATTLFQSIGMGVVTGVFEEGNLISGVKHIFIMCLITYITFKFVIGLP